jgi:pimeloyl-ACP methyl ester carboxylesterase
MKFLRVILSILAVLTIVYLFGPRPEEPVYSRVMPKLPDSPAVLENYIRTKEASHPVKPENESRIVWFNDSLKTPTEYAVVYLHGFSASPMEGDPVHREYAKTFGCNLYLARLAEHGLDTPDAMINLTADSYWESAKEALAAGKRIGKKVILMSTSTGGTNALQLAAAYPNDVAALLLMSPNIAINDPAAFVANNHWGLQVARLIMNGNYFVDRSPADSTNRFWYNKYRLEGIVALQEMLETTMTDDTFSKIKQPLLLLYYYKDELHQDPQVKVSAMKEMFSKVSTPAELKREVAMPLAGAHVLASPLKSKDVEGVKRELYNFTTEVLKIAPVDTLR